MSNQLLEVYFMVAFWAPPLAIVAGALLLLVPEPPKHRSAVGHHAVPLRH
jgi:hypothetical protein